MKVTYDALQQALQAREKELREQLAAMDSSARAEGVGYGNHMADMGSEVFEQARDVSLRRGVERNLEDVLEALKKFEDGTYGLCESCGAAIDFSRLEALPAARYCMQCQSRLEGQR